MRRTGLSGALGFALLAVLVAAYWPALHGGMLWDDDAHVTRADLRSVHGLWRIWSEPGATQQYYPVLHSAFWLEHRLWGDSPAGYHWTNLALHAAGAFLLFRALTRLGVPGALLGASVFALHPVCVESVAWISEQKNTLSAVFYLAAALAWLRFDEHRRTRDYLFGSVLFALALLSKSVTATLPAALLVILWWRRGTLGFSRDVLPLVPWLCMGAAAGAVTAWTEHVYIGAHGPAFGLGVAERVLLASRASWFYLGKLAWPAPLIFIYPRWSVDTHRVGQFLFPAAAAAAFALLYALRGRSRGPLAAGLLFVGALFPALGFINVYPFVFSYVADHFQYLAAAAMIPAACAGLTVALRSLPAPAPVRSPAAGAALVGVLACLTWRQCLNYRDIETFYRAILAGNPACWLAHDNLGIVLAQRGRLDEAAEHYREAIRLNSGYPETFNNYGNLLARTGRWSEAAQAYAGALRARPSFAEAEFNWGNAMSDAGLFQAAQAHFRNALRLREEYPEAHYGLANALANTGRLHEALAEYGAALSLRPDFPEAHANLGLALAELGRWTQALAQGAEAVRERPAYAEAHAYLGFALAGAGRPQDALGEYREALRVGPDSPDVHDQMGAALQALGRIDEASAQRAEARRLRSAR